MNRGASRLIKTGGALDRFYTYGRGDLCAWQVGKTNGGRGVFWLQTTDKAFARKLAKREDTRRVESSGYNHFRRTYEMVGDWRKIRRVIDRYFLSTSDTFSGTKLAAERLRLGREGNHSGPCHSFAASRR